MRFNFILVQHCFDLFETITDLLSLENSVHFVIDRVESYRSRRNLFDLLYHIRVV